MKKEKSKPGMVSIILAMVPLIVLGMILIWDNVPALQPPEMIWLGFLFFGVIIAPFIGFFFGLAGLFDKANSRLLPVIGTVLNLVWMGLVVAEMCNFSLSGMPF